MDSFNVRWWMTGARLFILGMIACLSVVNLNSQQSGGISGEIQGIALNPEESKWLADHPVIRYGADPKWPPFSIREGNELRGVDPEIMTLLGERLGVKFEYVPSSSWQETMQLFTQGDIAFITGMSNVEGRSLDVIYTDAYVGFPWAMIMRSDGPFFTNLSQLEQEGLSVSVPKDYASNVFLDRRYPRIRLSTTETALESLLVVSSGKAAASIENVGVASHLIKTNGLSNLKITGLIDGDFDSTFGVQQSLPELCGILNKAIRSLSEKDRVAIYDRWILVDLSKIRNWRSVVQVIGALLAFALTVIGVITISNRRLAGELMKRKAAEESLRQSEAKFRHLFETMQDAYFITQISGEIQLVNEEALTMLQLGSRPLVERLNIETLLLNPDDMDRLIELLREQGRLRDHVLEFARADGSECVCRCNVKMVSDDSGQEVGIEFVARPQ